MATTRTENVGPVILGLNKQNGQLRGQTKPVSVQSASAAPGKALAPPQTAGGGPQDGGGIKFGDDWKRNLKLPPKDHRVRTSVSLDNFICSLTFGSNLIFSWNFDIKSLCYRMWRLRRGMNLKITASKENFSWAFLRWVGRNHLPSR